MKGFLEKEEATWFAVAGGMGHQLLFHTSATGRLEPNMAKPLGVPRALALEVCGESHLALRLFHHHVGMKGSIASGFLIAIYQRSYSRHDMICRLAEGHLMPRHIGARCLRRQ